MNNYLQQAVARLNSEAAPDLSDASIDAAIGPCVGGRKFVALVKHMRNVGILTIADLHHLESGHDVGISVRNTPEVTPQATPEVGTK